MGAVAIRLSAPLSTEPKRCIFCLGKLSEAERRERLVLFENREVLVMLNSYPYNNGHLLVAPRTHVASPELLIASGASGGGGSGRGAIKRVRETLHPQALNVGANLGGAAGARFGDHMHWHVVPRWEGDNNFMPVLASTRVLSQSLAESFSQLRPIFKDIGAEIS